jgi:hypothetical protein
MCLGQRCDYSFYKLGAFPEKEINIGTTYILFSHEISFLEFRLQCCQIGEYCQIIIFTKSLPYLKSERDASN